MYLDTEIIDDRVTIDDKIAKVFLDGRLDIEGTDNINTLFTSLGKTKEAKILVDLTGVNFIASVGMRTFLKTATALSQRKGKLVLYNAQPLVKEALVSAGIDTLIPMYDEMDTAIASLME